MCLNMILNETDILNIIINYYYITCYDDINKLLLTSKYITRDNITKIIILHSEKNTFDNLCKFNNLESLEIQLDQDNPTFWDYDIIDIDNYKLMFLKLNSLYICSSIIINLNVLYNSNMLVNLDISNTSITNIDILQNCKYLEYLNILNCQLIRNTSLRPKYLKQLYMSGTDIDTLDILQECYNCVTNLYIGDMKDLKYIDILQKCINLTELNIEYTQIDDINVLQYCTKLEHVYIRGSNIGMITRIIYKTCPNLTIYL